MIKATIKQNRIIGWGWYWDYDGYSGYAFTRKGAEFAVKRLNKKLKTQNKRYEMTFEALDGEQ